MVDKSVFDTFTAALGSTRVTKEEIASYLDGKASELAAIMTDKSSSPTQVLETAQEFCAIAREHDLEDLVTRFETIAEKAAAAA